MINEFDYDPAAADDFKRNYLALVHGDAAPIHYPYTFIAPSNTGIPSGFDLDHDGATGGPGDAFGFGLFPGQFGMVVYSMFPIDYANVRTFQHFLWKDMPGALLPNDPAAPEPAGWYAAEELNVFRLSSKSHWDIPVTVGRETIHFLVSHPTPPVYDDPVINQNGRRNHDEIRFWADYITPSRDSYIYDDSGVSGGLKPGALFVIAGDQNADPLAGDSIPGAIQQLLDHPLVNDQLTPSSPGAVEQNALQGSANLAHRSSPAFDTAAFGDSAGNLRADYVLPCQNLTIEDAAVFWPLTSDPRFSLVDAASDHRLVWIDLTIPGKQTPTAPR